MSWSIRTLTKVEKRWFKSLKWISSGCKSSCERLTRKLAVSRYLTNEKIEEVFRDPMQRLMRRKISLRISQVFSNWNIYLETTKVLLKAKTIYLHSRSLKCKEFLRLTKFLQLSKDFKFLRTPKLMILEDSLTTTSRSCSSSTEISKTNVTHSIVFLNEWIKKNQKLLRSENKSSKKFVASESSICNYNNSLCPPEISQQANTSCTGLRSKLID